MWSICYKLRFSNNHISIVKRRKFSDYFPPDQSGTFVTPKSTAFQHLCNSVPMLCIWVGFSSVRWDKILQDLGELSSFIKSQIEELPCLVVFDDVWDGTIFRRGCLDIVPDFNGGADPSTRQTQSRSCPRHPVNTCWYTLIQQSRIGTVMMLLIRLLNSVWLLPNACLELE